MLSVLAKSFQQQSIKSSRRKSLSFNEDAADKLKHDENVIWNFLQQKDVPAWFRGTSRFQINAAEALLNALRDDTEQRTSHRVHGCLISIGLSPMVTSKEIHFLMRLSRGNDLAFLWFLMELHYKTPSENEYSVNEQLIMSSIAHLDMITTMRELDKVLPPGHPPLKEIRRKEQKALEAERKRALKAQNKNKPRKPKAALPYFDKLVRPKPYGKPLTIPIPDYKVSFERYENYKNPHYVVHNESNRWYAYYDLQPNRRIVTKILNEEIGAIFDDYARVSLHADTIHVLCEKHKTMKEEEERMEDELRVAARERCLKILDVHADKREETRRRILAQLEKDVEKKMCQFRAMCASYRRKSLTQTLNVTQEAKCCCKEAGVECKCGILESGPLECKGEKDKKPDGSNKDQITKLLDKDLGRGDFLDVKSTERLRIHSPRVNSARDARKTEGVDKLRRDSNLSTASKRRSRMSDFAAKYAAAYDFGHYLAPSPTPSETFFEGPRKNLPYHFDYRKIFHSKVNTDETVCIRRTFVEALDHDLETLNKLYDGLPQPTLAELASECALTMWKQGVKEKTKELNALDETESGHVREESPLDKYTQQYYDPDDRALMSKMLKDACEHIAKNTKFVLASMPDVNKLPILKEWIYARYGKVYTRADRYKSFRLSLKIFRALDKVTLNVSTPNTKELGTNLFVDYTCRDYLIKKADHIKRKYYDKLDDAIMEQARVFWFAMRPYLCSSGPPRNTYFAYMPSRVLDITRFRLWKPTEFMNAKQEWEKRKKIKQQQLY